MLSRKEHTVVLLALALLVGTWVICAACAGSLTIPHNDSWSHTKIAEVLAQTGQIQLVGWNRSFLMGMIFPVAMVGGSPLAGNLFSALCAFFMLYWSYKYTRLYIPIHLTWAVVAVIATVPGLALLSTSFMTDIPMCAGITGALYYCQQYFFRDSSKDLIISTALAVWSFTIREQGLAIIAAIFLVLVLKKRYRNALCFVFVSGIAVLFFEIWRRSLGHDDLPSIGLHIVSSTHHLLSGLLIFSLYLLPLTVLGATEKSFWNRRKLTIAVCLSGIALLYVAWKRTAALPPNYLSWKGAYAVAGIGQRQVFSPFVEQALIVIAALAFGPLCVFAARNILTRENLIGKFFALFYFTGVAMQTYAGQGMFGRYMIPLVIALAPTIIKGVVSRCRRKICFSMSLGMIGCIAVTIFLEALAFDGAIWQAAEKETERGTSTMAIEAGFTWYGYHSSYAAVQTNQSVPGSFTGYAAMFADARECVVIGAYDSRYEDDAQVVSTYKRYLFFGPEAYIYRDEITPCH